jgi:hypothetical protein
MCKDCAVKYYRLQGRCAKCPQGAYLLIVGYTCAIGKPLPRSSCFSYYIPIQVAVYSKLVCGLPGPGPSSSLLTSSSCQCCAVHHCHLEPCLALAVFLVGLLATARMKGVNLTALGIGVDFLQVVSVFTSFGFKWPIQLTTLFNAASISSFNEQLMAPECSIGSWSFGTKSVHPMH